MEVTMLEVNTLTNVLARPAVQASNILTQVGNTPLLDLSGYAHRHGVSPRVDLYAKAEWCNPGGSVKARAALRMVEEAEASGALTPGKVIIDSSSGNTGIALALIGAVKGYAVHLVMPANVSLERKALVKAYGATLIESDPLEGSDGAILHVRELVARSRPGTSMSTSTTTRPTGGPTTWAPGRRSGGRRRAPSPTSWRAWAPAAPSWARGATQGAQPGD